MIGMSGHGVWGRDMRVGISTLAKARNCMFLFLFTGLTKLLTGRLT
jgi:hypothetical protein